MIFSLPIFFLGGGGKRCPIPNMCFWSCIECMFEALETWTGSVQPSLTGQQDPSRDVMQGAPKTSILLKATRWRGGLRKNKSPLHHVDAFFPAFYALGILEHCWLPLSPQALPTGKYFSVRSFLQFLTGSLPNNLPSVGISAALSVNGLCVNGLRKSWRGNRNRGGNRPERFREGNPPLRGSLRGGVFRGFFRRFFRGFFRGFSGTFRRGVTERGVFAFACQYIVSPRGRTGNRTVTQMRHPLLVEGRPNCARQSLASTLSAPHVAETSCCDPGRHAKSCGKCHYPLFAYPMFKRALYSKRMN